METIVWWNAGWGGSGNKEVEWRPLLGGRQGGESLDEEVQ